MDKLKRFFINGLLMTAVTILIRYISVSFNIYISNKIGASAMGLFTLISSVYGFAVTIATSGISLATTRLVSEAMGLGRTRQDFNESKTVFSIMKKSILFSLSISSATAVALFLLSPFIGERLLNDSRTVSSLQILAFSLPCIAVSSSIGGYFTAVRRVHKNAAVQMIGQGVKIYLCVMLLSATVATDMESACIAIVIGSVGAEAISFVIHSIIFIIERIRQKNALAASAAPPDKALPKKLIPITMPVAFSAYMRSALVTIEHLLIPWGLERSGASRDISLAAYGTVHSVVFPLVLFPSSISSSFAGLLVPEISESNAACDNERIQRIICRVLKTVLIYSIGVAGIMMCLSGELGFVLFPESNAAKYILFVSPLIPVMYMDTSVDSILKGLGYQFYTMIINIVDASMSVILVWILLPRFGIMGYIITVYFTEIVNATLSIGKLIAVTRPKIKILDWIAKPILCVIISTALVRLALSSFNIFATSRIELFLHISLASIIYLLLLALCGSLSPRKIKRSIIGFIKA